VLEQRRLDYLQAMGITQWMPRQPLPDAPEPRWLPAEAANHHSHQEVDELAQSHHIPPVMAAELLSVGDVAERIAQQQGQQATQDGQTPPDAGRSASHGSSPAAAVSPSNAVVSGAAVSPAGENRVAASADAVQDLSPPRFELHFLPVGKAGLWVCSDAQQLDSMMRFAHRVMQGMRQPIDMMAAPLSFRWPFIESSHQDQSRAVAEQALQAQYQYFTSQGVQYVISFGEHGQQWLPVAGAEAIFHAPSLDALMAAPALKRQLWLALSERSEPL
jgi:hypothetical protein